MRSKELIMERRIKKAVNEGLLKRVMVLTGIPISVLIGGYGNA